MSAVHIVADAEVVSVMPSELFEPLTLQSGPPTTVTYAGSSNRYLPQGVSRPNVLSPDYVTPNWEIGPNRFPTSSSHISSAVSGKK